MFRMIIIDDDEIICNGLKRSIDWISNGIEIIGTAYDGMTALEMIRREIPDIIISDINLPLLDGLELTGIIRQELPDIKVILITAYEEFEFAKRAVHLNVCEYITKPFDSRNILETAYKAVESIKRERDIKNRIIESLPLLKEKYLYELVTDRLDEEKIGQVTEFVGLSGDDTYFGVAVIQIRNLYMGFQKESRDFNSIIQSEFISRNVFTLLSSLNENDKAIVFNTATDEMAIIFHRFYGRMPCEEHIKNTALLIKQYFEDFDEYSISIGVGNIHSGFKGISRSYAEAKQACELRYHFGNKRVNYYSEIPVDEEVSSVDFTDRQKQIVDNFKLGNIEKVETILAEIFNTLVRNEKTIFAEVQITALEIIIMIYKSIQEVIDDKTKITHMSKKIIPEILKQRTIDDITDLLREKIYKIHEVLAEKKKSTNQKLIESSVQYIRENSANPDFTLEHAAKYVHLSPSYFSTLFKQIEKVNFSDFLTGLRIKNAVDLFTSTELKTYEVAYKVGYNSPQYFNLCFKRITGYSPSEFKMINNS